MSDNTTTSMSIAVGDTTTPIDKRNQYTVELQDDFVIMSQVMRIARKIVVSNDERINELFTWRT